MPREIAVFDLLVPSLLLAFFLAVALFSLLDWVLGRAGFYHLVWHPPLFRLCLFVCVFGGLGLYSLT